jgi:hypothetical protein
MNTSGTVEPPPNHATDARTTYPVVDRSDSAKHPEPARRLGTLSEELTDVRSGI